MSALRRLSAACSTLLVASGLVLVPFLTGPAAAAELLQDGGFESATGNPLNSPNWSETNSPLCTTAICGSTGGTARSGTKWARFGGSSTAGQTSGLSQAVTIPAGTASLTYWYRNGVVSPSSTPARLLVRVDSTTVMTHTEASSAQGSYGQQTINLSAYANGAAHTISFAYTNGSTGNNTMTVDDVSLNHTPPPVTATPTVTSTVPATQGNTTAPLVKGTAETGSTVTLYSNSSCSSAALGNGPAATFAGAGIAATVPANATTTIYARASKSGQSNSACSSTSVSYTSDTTAPPLVTFSSVTPASPNPSTTPVLKGTAQAGSTVKLYATVGLHRHAGRDGHGGGVLLTGADGDGGRGHDHHLQGDRDGRGGQHVRLLDQLARLRERSLRRRVRGRDGQPRAQPLVGRGGLPRRLPAVPKRPVTRAAGSPPHGRATRGPGSVASPTRATPGASPRR